MLANETKAFGGIVRFEQVVGATWHWYGLSYFLLAVVTGTSRKGKFSSNIPYGQIVATDILYGFHKETSHLNGPVEFGEQFWMGCKYECRRDLQAAWNQLQII
jgi:hypothetical protein